MKIKENSFIAKIAAKKLNSNSMAITIGSTIHLCNTSRQAFLSDERWVRHEMQHVKQFKRYGFIRFLFMYTWESLRHGYYNNKWEKEARDAEDEIK
ncbi:MAG: DUF4157 domain-containing protein [Pseudopedobacter saltans]|uniref:DUF4157 domain-containing protein n=1 Tax=Pseudopedobacter saltans TaxID=151895 RepID=A0A2W5F493_9SPHI|nr:MAG: DUF4157 domain-containing protein [Pseudopedobacter saltans]